MDDWYLHTPNSTAGLLSASLGVDTIIINDGDHHYPPFTPFPASYRGTCRGCGVASVMTGWCKLCWEKALNEAFCVRMYAPQSIDPTQTIREVTFSRLHEEQHGSDAEDMA